jgi:hypothetical protein
MASICMTFLLSVDLKNDRLDDTNDLFSPSPSGGSQVAADRLHARSFGGFHHGMSRRCRDERHTYFYLPMHEQCDNR